MNRRRIALVLNIAALIAGVVGIVFRIVRNFDDFFLYYTQLSNVAAVISSAMYIIFFNSDNERVRAFVRGARYLGACGLTLTFIVVMCVFLPVGGADAAGKLLATINGILHHSVCPVLSIVSYLFFEEGVRSRKAVLIPIVATAVYAFTLYTLNFLRLAKAPYPFFEVYEHEIFELILWFVGMILLTVGIAVAVRLVNLKVSRKSAGGGNDR